MDEVDSAGFPVESHWRDGRNVEHPGDMRFSGLSPARLRLARSRRRARPASQQNMGEASPAAQCFRAPRWGDTRLWIGLLLLVVSMFAGAKLLSQESEAVTVWQVGRDLSVGAEAIDLKPITVALGQAQEDYFSVDEIPAGRLRFPVESGELLPRSAMTGSQQEPSRVITVGVDPFHAPVDVAPGDRVDVWSTPSTSTYLPDSPASNRSPDPQLALESVLVERVESDSLGGRKAVVLRVTPENVGDLVRASRSGTIDLIKVPVQGFGS